MTRDEVLTKAFEAVLLANRETTVQVYEDTNMHYYVGKHAVLYGYASTTERAALSGILGLTESEHDLSEYSLKHFGASDRIPLKEWEQDVFYMPVKRSSLAGPGIWVIKQAGDQHRRIGKYEYSDNTLSISELGTCLWTIPLHIVSAIANSGFKPNEFLPFLTTQANATQSTRALLIALMGENYCLYASLARSSNDIPGILVEDGKEYILDGYNFELGTWENIKEKRAMSKLKPPVVAPTPIDDLPLDEPEVSLENIPGVQAEVEAEPAPDLVPEEPQLAPEPEQVTPAEPEDPATPVAEVEQPKVVRKPKAPQPFDYKGAMQYMASDIPEDNSVDKAIEEIRALRDLQFSVTRRMANLAMESMTAFKKDSEQLQAIQRLLKG